MTKAFHTAFIATQLFASLAWAGKHNAHSTGQPACTVCPKTIMASPASFYKVFGGKNYDATADVAKVKAGGIVMAGRSNSYSTAMSDMNINVVRLDANGNVLWDKTFGGPETEEANAVIETREGGFLVVGSSDSYGGGPDLKNIWMVKLDKDGKKLWDKAIGSTESIDDARSVVQNDDGSFVLLANSVKMASSRTEIQVYKLSEKGDVLWKRNFGGEGNVEGNQIVKTPNGGYAVVGSKEAVKNKKWDFWLITLDKEGFRAWEQTYGGGDSDRGNTIAVTDSSGFVMAGHSYSFAEGSHDVWVVKTDAKGQKLWTKNMGGLSADEALDLVITKDRRIVLAGYTEVFIPDENNNNTSKDGSNVLITMIEGGGKEVWSKSLGGVGGQRATAIVEDTEGNFIVAGMADTQGTDHLIMKISKEGAVSQ